MNGHVYFIRDGVSIKIGFSVNVDSRLKGLQTSSANRLDLLAVVEGDFALERAVHRRLHAHRILGEWFEDCDEVRKVMADVCERGIEAVAKFYEPIPERSADVLSTTAPRQDRRIVCLGKLAIMARAIVEADLDEAKLDASDRLFDKIERTFHRMRRVFDARPTEAALTQAERRVAELLLETQQFVGGETLQRI